ncbi:hypothetical protein [Nocardioides zeae]|uniref:Uncharacterized protein n=1 Tax=Nocardioides zeae TaxID=1457234 RepID=A0AAJ1TYK1_9ACTN|nr:hypothetical protein [Nocardioides zeae]MDQ1104375.1 hypothetical protein [Nocardioides zeae]
MTIIVLLLALIGVAWFAATYRALLDDRGNTPPRSHPDDTFSPRRELH